MNYCIEIDSAKKNNFVPLPEMEEKGWSYSSVYFLEDIRDVYILYKARVYRTIEDIYDKIKEADTVNGKLRKWTKRQVLEIVNALRNFGLLSLDGKTLKNVLFETEIGQPLSEKDKEIFVDIYLNYFRFKEFHSFFLQASKYTIDDLQNNSQMILTSITSGRFINFVIRKIGDQIETTEFADKYSAVKRFWDVYLKWGTFLGLLNKFPVKQVGITTNPSVKALQCVYFKKDMPVDFSVFEYLLSKFRDTYIYIPDAIYSIAQNLRYSLEDIKQKLLDECMYRDEYRAQSTSSFYINQKENFLFPKLGNTYITHLLKI